MQRPFSLACENNKQPILTALRPALADCHWVLEIGSGTGQHAVHFAPALPQLLWQCSDLPENLPGINLWIEAYPSPNLLAPMAFDMNRPQWPTEMDAAYSANTAHIMPWRLVVRMIEGIGARLPSEGVFALYGPFNYRGQYTSESNAAFDQWLKGQDPERGIRDFERIAEVATRAGLQLAADHALPANNRLLIWRKR